MREFIISFFFAIMSDETLLILGEFHRVDDAVIRYLNRKPAPGMEAHE